MKPIKFSWAQTHDPHLASLVKSDPEFAERVRKSIANLEGWLEEYADSDRWDEIDVLIPCNQLVKNDITMNDAGSDKRMFVFLVLNKKPIEQILKSVMTEHYTHIVYLSLIDSIKG